MAVKIACDSSVDLSKEYYEENNVSVLPFTITLGDTDYLDGISIDNEMIFDFVAKNKILPKTSAINEYQYADFFKEHLSEDGLVFISISSKSSCAYNNAIVAAKNFENVYVLDSLSLSTGGGLLVTYAVELSKKGLSAKEIFEKLEEKRKKVQASFTIDRLEYLHKGGRCSSVALLGANLLKLHPQVQLKNGAMMVNKKYRGRMAEVVKTYIDDTLAEFEPDKKLCFLTHSNSDPEIVESARQYLESKKIFDKIVEAHAGSTVTSHCGKNTLGILYFMK